MKSKTIVVLVAAVVGVLWLRKYLAGQQEVNRRNAIQKAGAIDLFRVEEVTGTYQDSVPGVGNPTYTDPAGGALDMLRLGGKLQDRQSVCEAATLYPGVLCL